MSDTRPAERDLVRVLSGVLIFLLAVAWIGGTIALFLAAIDKSFCMGCEVSEHNRLLADRLILDSVACAGVFPLLAALICALTRRRLGAVLFLIPGVSVALVYGMFLGVPAARDLRHSQLPTSAPVPSGYCPCYSGGSCDCPGG